MSSAVEAAPGSTPIEAQLARLLGEPVAVVGSLAGGRNARVYRVDAKRLGRLVAKQTCRSAAMGRDFLRAEARALRFLWDRGERRIPRLVAADLEAGWLVTEAVDGEPVAAAGPQDIDAAVGFLLRLRHLSGSSASAALPPASEACFSMRAIVDSIQARLRRLDDAGVWHPDLRAFLEGEVKPALADRASRCERHCLDLGMCFAFDLPAQQRTLSPSDFGFHNSLRTATGLVFLDFEHFGWDDPAKTLCDFVLHPGMAVPQALGRRFARALLDGLSDPDLAARAVAVYPLYALKWTTILLNEFVRDDLRRRAFAAPGMDAETLQAQQLDKARCMLQNVEPGSVPDWAQP